MRDRVEVYDSVNTDRLLGTMDRPSFPHCGTRFQVLVLDRAEFTTFAAPREAVDMAVRTVTFTLHERREDDGWTRRFVLVTNAPLEQLQQLRGWRYAGESARSAKNRLYMAAYGG